MSSKYEGMKKVSFYLKPEDLKEIKELSIKFEQPMAWLLRKFTEVSLTNVRKNKLNPKSVIFVDELKIKDNTVENVDFGKGVSFDEMEKQHFKSIEKNKSEDIV